MTYDDSDLIQQALEGNQKRLLHLLKNTKNRSMR